MNIKKGYVLLLPNIWRVYIPRIKEIAMKL